MKICVSSVLFCYYSTQDNDLRCLHAIVLDNVYHMNDDKWNFYNHVIIRVAIREANDKQVLPGGSRIAPEVVRIPEDDR